MDAVVNLHADLVTEIINVLQKKRINPLREKILLSLPDNIFTKGSKLWWEQGNLKAKQDIASGRIYDTLN